MRRPLVLLSLCLLLGGATPAAAQPDSDRLDLLDGEPIQLTAPTQQSLVQLQEEWQQWLNGFQTMEREPFEERVEQMISETRRLGMRRLPELSRAASALAVEAARQGDRERATWALNGAERLDPGRPETAFRRAQVARMEADWGTVLISWAEGYVRLFRGAEGWGLRSLLLWIAYALLLAGAVWMALRMIARGPGLFADLDGFLAQRMPAALAHAVAVLLLTWPLILPHGLLWVLVYWSILLWSHASGSERVVTVFLWVLVAALPVLSSPGPTAEVTRSPAYRALDGLARDRLYGRLFVDLEQVVERFPDEPAVVHLLADFHRELQQWDISRRYYQRLLELEADNAAALIDLGAYYFYNNDFGAAVRYFRRAAEAEPQNVIAWFDLSQAYGGSYLFDESQEALRAAQEIDDGLVSHYQDISDDTRIVTVDGGYARIPSLMERLRTELPPSEPIASAATETPTPWWTLLLVPFAWVLAWGLERFRRAPTVFAGRLGIRDDSTARGLRILLPGLASLEEGSGGRAFAALAAPASLVTLPAVSRLADPLPPGAGEGELWGLAVVGLVVYFSVRFWWDLTQR